ncbi:serine/threonine protein kinase [Fusarium verticillioides 7600]|uniref:Serine/threonine protein kinase n=1 Tax=Gibberella moniliformis (strain M3125 / FGSC 7600) TaxID=334819 RepID=W7LKE3_GIBM7|nr:serine/threonine protein kinase [Fusarium verticillioides 7600]EWG35899.1 serine/threonine protein kinase [Fusarium verticillioides 7600]
MDRVSIMGVNGKDQVVSYIPFSILQKYWTEDRISQILNSSVIPITENVQLIAERYLRIFSTFVYGGFCDKLSWVFRNHTTNMDDDRLPFDESIFENTSDWTTSFLKHQWMFCPVEFTDESCHQLALDLRVILPVAYGEYIKEHRTGPDRPILRKVNFDSGCDSYHIMGERAIFKVYEGHSGEVRYNAETDAYLKLRKLSTDFITKCLASFYFPEAHRFIIVLEYAEGGSLTEYLESNLPPTTTEDLLLLWKPMLSLSGALEVLNAIYQQNSRSPTFVGLHQEIHPGNILVFPRGKGTSRFDVQFKFKGFGMAPNAAMSASDMKLRLGSRQNRIYVSPEVFNFVVNGHSDAAISRLTDIWSLGALFSDFLVWTMTGLRGQEKYRLQRRAEISETQQFCSPGYDCCFHDGEKRLKAIDEAHNNALECWRNGDFIPPAISDVILDCMLVEPRDRLDAIQVKQYAANKLKHYQPSLDGILPLLDSPDIDQRHPSILSHQHIAMRDDQPLSEGTHTVRTPMSTVDHFHRHISENLREGLNGNGEKVFYVIPSALDSYWTERRVDIILNSQQPPVASSPDMIISDFPRVFSILTHIGRPQEISWLCNDMKGLDDHRIPFDEGCFPPTCQWANEFLREQWMFIPLFFPQNKILSRAVHPKTILPVTYQKQLTQKRGGRNTATLWEVQVHSGESLTASEDQPVVFKVYEGTGAEDLYNAETDVYLKLRTKNNKYITKHLASFSFQGERKYVIVLEYAAGGSLKDFFKNTPIPARPNEFRLLWSRLLKLLDALHVLHDLYRPDGAPVWFLAGVHQDIQPANILVFPEKDKDSRFDVKFKLTDFGLAEIGRISTSGGKLATENRGNRMYISPESFANFSVQDTVRTDLPPTADIWALGAVFSDVLVWSISGEPAREQYRLRRRAEISSQRHLKERDHDACFHDGMERLAAVEESHKLALQNKRGNDNISPYMSEIILDYMLTDEHERLPAMNIRMRAEKKIKNMTEVSLDNGQTVVNIRPMQACHTSPNRRRTVPNPSLPSLPQAGHDRLPVHQEVNQFCASPRTSLDYATVGPSSPTLSVTQLMSPPINNAQLQVQTPKSPLAVTKVTVNEVYRIIEKSSHSSFTSSIGMRSDKAKEIMKLPGMEEARIKIAVARGRDQIMLIDNFRSMEQYKSDVIKTARVISYVAKAVDEDGMELYAASEVAKKPRICKTSSQIEKAIAKMPTVDGTCNMRGCLDTILDRVLVGRKVKPTSIYIYTDGVWEPGADPVKFSIKRAIDYLIKCGQPSSTLMFQFVQFGSDTEGTGRLKYLDNKCVREVETESYDIVDTKHCDDHVPNIVIGSFSRYADEVGSSEEGQLKNNADRLFG